MWRSTSRWWAEDREDARQTAALQILLAGRRGLDKDRGYYFGAARKGVAMWIRAWLRPSRATFPLLVRFEELLAAETSMADSMLRNLESLAPLLRGQRIKSRKSTDAEIELEIEYCLLMIEGYTIDEAAVKLGRTRRNTHALRERVVPRLQMIADGKQPEIKPVNVNPASIAALRKLAGDPEAVRARNKAISAAKRRRDQIRRTA
jgi:hypothetical protein